MLFVHFSDIYFLPSSIYTDAATKGYVDNIKTNLDKVIGTGPLHTGPCVVDIYSISQSEFSRGKIYILDGLAYILSGSTFTNEWVYANFSRSGILMQYYNNQIVVSTNDYVVTKMSSSGGYSISWQIILGVGWREFNKAYVADSSRYGYRITSL